MGKRAPRPTPPSQVAAAQTGSSIDTGVSNAFLTNMNEYTPDGSRTFDQTGDYTFTDSNGVERVIPRFSVTETLSPEQQAIKDQNDRAGLNLSTLGADLSGTLGQQLTGNFSLGNEETEARLMELGSARLDPAFERRNETLRTQLSNQGIKEGSTAFDRAMSRLGEQENDAYNQLLLTGRGQASQELLTEDNQRINQISALMSGGQVSQPNFATTPGISNMAGTDMASIIANNDNAKMNAYMSKQALLGDTLGAAGGLFSLGLSR